uniref:MPL proto-oncogene, thrombopoietin receptor n=1 Tax=Chelydra serpentina TaxID=8475 RepID=A0A8C3T8M2_CHESE
MPKWGTLLPDARSSPGPSPLNKVSETIRCFSRSFEDLTCFWEEEEEAERGNHTYRFYYTYSGERAKQCVLGVQRRSSGGRRYVCIFPSSHEVRLFTQLCIRVLDTSSNQTKYSREVAVETVGLIAPPVNITATWTGAAGELQVRWEPPATEYTELFIYEILYCIVGSMEPPHRVRLCSSCHCRLTRACVLHTLQPGAKYHIRIRTKPDGLSLDGFWGPCSLALSCPGEIGLRCFTPDLQWVRCEWTWDPADSNSSHSLFYRRGLCWTHCALLLPRGQAWQRCQEHSAGPQSTHACMFQPRNDSDIFILVNVSRGRPEPVLSYFGEPFQVHQAVLTSPPRILQANVSSGQLRLQWAPPQEELAEYMVYQIRYSVENSLDWKVLQIQHAANSETLDLRAGPRYLLQVRAKPNGQQLQGFWSAWSETIVARAVFGGGGHQERKLMQPRWMLTLTHRLGAPLRRDRAWKWHSIPWHCRSPPHKTFLCTPMGGHAPQFENLWTGQCRGSPSQGAVESIFSLSLSPKEELLCVCESCSYPRPLTPPVHCLCAANMTSAAVQPAQ